MSDFFKKLDGLSPEKRALLAMFLKEKGYEEDALEEEENDYVAPRDEVEEKLAAIWASVLGLERVGIHDNFFEIGGDSIQSIQIIVRANKAGIGLTSTQLFKYLTIAELRPVVGASVAASAEQGAVSGPAPLTPIQHWFFDLRLAEPDYWNQALLLRTRPGLHAGHTEAVFNALLDHHDGLRFRFTSVSGSWQAENQAPGERLRFEHLDLSETPPAERMALVEALAAERQAGLNLERGPLFHIVLFDFGPDHEGRLFVLSHHILVDGVSYRILLEDFENGYAQLQRGEPITLPPKTTSFKSWAHKLVEYSQSGAHHEELDYWLGVNNHAGSIFRDHRGANLESAADTVETALSEAETRQLLNETLHRHGAQINEVLLTALASAMAAKTGEPGLLLDLEGHGREELMPGVDLSRTVGWFTSVFPVFLNIGAAPSPGEALAAVKRCLRDIPHRGIGYGLLRYLADPADERVAALKNGEQPELIFNYLGQFDRVLSQTSPLSPGEDRYGPSYGPVNHRPYVLNLVSRISGGRLSMTWMYCRKLHDPETIEALAAAFVAALRGLMNAEPHREAGVAPEADLSESDLSGEDLEELLAGDL